MFGGNMKRRDFITKAGLGTAAVAGATLAAPALAQERKVLTCVSSWGRDFPGLGTSAQNMHIEDAELQRITTTGIMLGYSKQT